MGEHVFRVFLSDIARVRICCKNCNTCLEVPLAKLDSVHVCCPTCSSEFVPRPELSDRTNRRFAALKAAFDDLSDMNDNYTVEFPIKLPEKP